MGVIMGKMSQRYGVVIIKEPDGMMSGWRRREQIDCVIFCS
jgi:hypothetical protein